MSTRLINIDRDTPLLLPPDMRDWVPADDLVHFVIEAVAGMKLDPLKVNRTGSGSEQYPPRMMLALLIYCYALGEFSSRRIERATYRDVGVRFLTADTHPGRDTICAFRRENFDVVSHAFLCVLKLAREMGVLKVGTVSVDGTHVQANASKHKTVGYERAGQIEEQLKLDIAALMEKANQADAQNIDDGQTLPESIARREKLRERMAEARRTIEAQTKAKAEAEREVHDRKMAERKERRDNDDPPENGTPRAARAPEPGAKDSVNLTDPDSRLMLKTQGSEFRQAYNAQAVVDADGSMLILATGVTQCAGDSQQLMPMVHAIDGEIGVASVVLADTGYVDADAIEKLEKEGKEMFVAVRRADNHGQRRYDYRPRGVLEKARRDAEKQPKDPRLQAMQKKLQTAEGRKTYAKRKETVEPVFGVIKSAMGFRQCLLRGLEKVRGEWSLVSLAYNVRRLWSMKKALAV